MGLQKFRFGFDSIIILRRKRYRVLESSSGSIEIQDFFPKKASWISRTYFRWNLWSCQTRNFKQFDDVARLGKMQPNHHSLFVFNWEELWLSHV